MLLWVWCTVSFLFDVWNCAVLCSKVYTVLHVTRGCTVYTGLIFSRQLLFLLFPKVPKHYHKDYCLLRCDANLVGSYWRFRGTCCLHHQKTSQAWRKWYKYSEGENRGSDKSNRSKNGVKNTGTLWGHFMRAGYSPHHEKLTSQIIVNIWAKFKCIKLLKRKIMY
jgi:hypothetical protein